MEAGRPAWQARIWFGATDASALIVDLHTKQSIKELSSAEVVLKLDPSFPEPIDLFSEVKISAVGADGREEELFTGNVLEATPEGETVRLRMQAGTSLTERNPSPRWTRGVDVREQIYTIVRESGFPHERTQIPGLDEIPEEPMLVIVPIHGVELEGRVTIGEVTFVPDGDAARPFADRGVLDLVYGPLVETQVHAVHQTSAQLLRDAESAGLQAIDVVLGYLQLTGRYGLLFRPDGSPQPFDRSRSRTHPRRGEVVAVEALGSARCWVRVPEDRTPALELALHQVDVLGLERELTVAERQALIAWRRATSEQDAVAAATALSDALEFYAAGVAAAALFEEEEIKLLLESVPAFGPHKQRVVRDAIKRLNAAPLRRRVIEAARRDGVPLTAAEVDFLWRRIRNARNGAVHGKGAEPPILQELELASSIVGRLLAHRIASEPRSESAV